MRTVTDEQPALAANDATFRGGIFEANLRAFDGCTRDDSGKDFADTIAKEKSGGDFAHETLEFAGRVFAFGAMLARFVRVPRR